MARGPSGRVVLEVDPDLKDELYVELARKGLTLRAWFISRAEDFVAPARQPALFVAEPATRYEAHEVKGDESGRERPEVVRQRRKGGDDAAR